MTAPGRKTNLHYIPYDGNIEANIDEVRANQLIINETADVSRTLTAQIQRMTDANVDGFEYALPTASGLIAKCENPQQAYDAVYGSAPVAVPAAKTNVVDFKPFSSISLNATFGGVAQNDNGVSRAPVMHSAFDRAASRAPAFGGMDFEARALIAA